MIAGRSEVRPCEACSVEIKECSAADLLTDARHRTRSCVAVASKDFDRCSIKSRDRSHQDRCHGTRGCFRLRKLQSKLTRPAALEGYGAELDRVTECTRIPLL